MSERERILARRSKLIAAALVSVAVAPACSSPQACLSPKCEPPICGAQDAGDSGDAGAPSDAGKTDAADATSDAVADAPDGG